MKMRRHEANDAGPGGQDRVPQLGGVGDVHIVVCPGQELDPGRGGCREVASQHSPGAEEQDPGHRAGAGARYRAFAAR